MKSLDTDTAKLISTWAQPATVRQNSPQEDVSSFGGRSEPTASTATHTPNDQDHVVLKGHTTAPEDTAEPMQATETDAKLDSGLFGDDKDWTAHLQLNCEIIDNGGHTQSAIDEAKRQALVILIGGPVDECGHLVTQMIKELRQLRATASHQPLITKLLKVDYALTSSLFGQREAVVARGVTMQTRMAWYMFSLRACGRRRCMAHYAHATHRATAYMFGWASSSLTNARSATPQRSHGARCSPHNTIKDCVATTLRRSRIVLCLSGTLSYGGAPRALWVRLLRAFIG
jgi:hypothetical protein